jgi:hypothetical protein
VIKKGGIFKKEVLEENIYQSPMKSLYVKTGDFFAWLSFFFSFIWCILIIKKGVKGEKFNV